MAILFDRIPAAEIGTKYTHWGYIHGWVPVYLGGMEHDDGPVVAVLNGVPEWLEPVGRWIYYVASKLAEMTVPGFRCRGWSINVMGRV